MRRAQQFIPETTRRNFISQSAPLVPFDDVLQTEPVTVKLLYLWLGSTKEISLSQREIARALGISQGAVSLSLARLRALRLEVNKEADSRGNATPAPLPATLLKENPTTKLACLYFLPYGELEVSVRQLEELLGVSHRPAFEALKQLVELGLLQELDAPKNRARKYRVYN